jgi:hypothetical protein
MMTILYYHVKFLHPAWEEQTELFIKVYDNAAKVYPNNSIMMAKQKAVYVLMMNRLQMDNLTQQGLQLLASLCQDLFDVAKCICNGEDTPILIEPVILDATLWMTKRNTKKAMDGYNEARRLAVTCFKNEPDKLHNFINYFRLLTDKYFKADIELQNQLVDLCTQCDDARTRIDQEFPATAEAGKNLHL